MSTARAAPGPAARLGHHLGLRAAAAAGGGEEQEDAEDPGQAELRVSPAVSEPGHPPPRPVPLPLLLLRHAGTSSSGLGLCTRVEI